MKNLAQIGIIGGSGFYDFFGPDAKEVDIKTEFGKPSDKITIGNAFGKKVAFLPRHQRRHIIPPHNVPFKANLAALKEIGVKTVIATSTAGSLKQKIRPNDFVICDQFVDRTKQRDDTYFHGPKVAHIEAAYPYCQELRKLATLQAKKLGYRVHPKGTVVIIEGPRFATVAESMSYSKMGCDIINMTQYPEMVLAAELGICYTNIAVVTDYDSGIYAGKKVEPVSVEQILTSFKKNNERVKKLISEIIKNLPAERKCDCQKKAERAVI